MTIPRRIGGSKYGQRINAKPERNRQIASRIVCGETAATIAVDLGLSVHTVRKISADYQRDAYHRVLRGERLADIAADYDLTAVDFLPMVLRVAGRDIGLPPESVMQEVADRAEAVQIGVRELIARQADLREFRWIDEQGSFGRAFGGHNPGLSILPPDAAEAFLKAVTAPGKVLPGLAAAAKATAGTLSDPD